MTLLDVWLISEMLLVLAFVSCSLQKLSAGPHSARGLKANNFPSRASALTVDRLLSN